jgi:hypothetical protein
VFRFQPLNSKFELLRKYEYCNIETHLNISDFDDFHIILLPKNQIPLKLARKFYRKDERNAGKTSSLHVYSIKKPSRLGRSKVCFGSGLSGLGLRV